MVSRFLLLILLLFCLFFIFFFLFLDGRTLDANNELRAELGSTYAENKMLHGALDGLAPAAAARSTRPPIIVPPAPRAADERRWR